MSRRSKAERLAEVWARLAVAAAASTHDGALELLNATFREVEDELTEIPYAPDHWRDDGRLYAPQEDHARDTAGRADLVRYRSKGHNTLIRTNGAIEVRDAAGNVVFAKQGADGTGIEFD